jgi:hypothetical protein
LPAARGAAAAAAAAAAEAAAAASRFSLAAAAAFSCASCAARLAGGTYLPPLRAAAPAPLLPLSGPLLALRGAVAAFDSSTDSDMY